MTRAYNHKERLYPAGEVVGEYRPRPLKKKIKKPPKLCPCGAKLATHKFSYCLDCIEQRQRATSMRWQQRRRGRLRKSPCSTPPSSGSSPAE
jgi:hypothetical protein